VFSYLFPLQSPPKHGFQLIFLIRFLRLLKVWEEGSLYSSKAKSFNQMYLFVVKHLHNFLYCFTVIFLFSPLLFFVPVLTNFNISPHSLMQRISPFSFSYFHILVLFFLCIAKHLAKLLSYQSFGESRDFFSSYLLVSMYTILIFPSTDKFP
jgi:hypothetical protein